MITQFPVDRKIQLHTLPFPYYPAEPTNRPCTREDIQRVYDAPTFAFLPRRLIQNPEAELPLEPPIMHFGWILNTDAFFIYKEEHPNLVYEDTSPLRFMKAFKNHIPVDENLDSVTFKCMVQEVIGFCPRATSLAFVRDPATRNVQPFFSVLTNAHITETSDLSVDALCKLLKHFGAKSGAEKPLWYVDHMKIFWTEAPKRQTKPMNCFEV